MTELTITDFAIIDRVQLQLAPGFNVLTGETGAGKSIIVDAVGQLLGDRADTTLIRAGAERARIEGVFTLNDPTVRVLMPLLEAYGLLDSPDEARTLILTRELHRSGRSTARVNGRAVTVGVLQEIGQHLVDIHGQSEHLSLKRVREHVNFLDRYAGLEDQRRALAEAVAELRRVRDELEALRRDERELVRRADLLTYQVQEIAEAQLVPGEEEELTAEHNRLVNAERLLLDANAVYEALYGEEEPGASVADLLGEATRLLRGLERIDPTLKELREQAEALSYAVEDLAHAVRRYRDELEFDPARLAEVEQRLTLIANLKRKYGDSIEEILAFGQRAAEELARIAYSEERIAELEAAEERLLQRIGEMAAELSARRQEAAARLAQAVEGELERLRMSGARFVVQIQQTEAPEGVPVNGTRYAFDATGIDRVEFLISPNPGEPPRPLARIASGGETSRLMLALKSTLAAADEIPTLVFDEIDVGIGGRVGHVVGQMLWGLTCGGGAGGHQVLCVTHLPQVAVYADAHFQIRKVVEGERTVTRVRRLDDAARVEELSQMLGSTSKVTRQKAEEMLQETREWKKR